MADTTHIEWTDATWNVITGCDMVDAGCTNCYAMQLAGSRLRNHPSRQGLTRVTGGRAKWTGEVRFNEGWLDQPLRWTRPRRIFVCAHGDLFHPAVPDEWIDRVFAVMALATQHTFQVLTKRPERAREYVLRAESRIMDLVCDRAVNEDLQVVLLAFQGVDPGAAVKGRRVALYKWPLPNVWLGTSISDQASADLRVPHLVATPAAVRFLSAEPLLGKLRLDRLAHGDESDLDALRGLIVHTPQHRAIPPGRAPARLDWVIVGGESGAHARAMHPDWARSLRDQCVAAGVAFFFKQWGEWITAAGLPGHLPIGHVFEDGFQMIRLGKTRAGRLLDGRTWDQMPGVQHG